MTIGDSITQGFMSGAIFRTDLSWPAIVANELGFTRFRYPTYEPPDGPGGIPLDLERLARFIDRTAGPTLSWNEVLGTARRLRSYMDKIEDYWERGPGSKVPPTGPVFHNLAVYGWALLDVLVLDADRLQARIAAHPPRDNVIDQIVENDNDRAGLVVAQRARAADGTARTVLEAAASLGEEGASGQPGIETLVVMLGANNALGAVGPPGRLLELGRLPGPDRRRTARRRGLVHRVPALALRGGVGRAGRGDPRPSGLAT